MKRDSIIEEIRAIREAYAERFNYDLGAIYEDLKEKERKSGREVVSLSPKQLQEEERAVLRQKAEGAS